MFRILLFVVLSGLMAGPVYGQGLGRVRTALAGALPDTSRARLLLDLAEVVVEREPDSALAWSGHAFVLSRRADHLPGQARAHLMQARSKALLGDLNGAETALSLARADYGQLHQVAGEVKCEVVAGEIALRKLDFMGALEASLRIDTLLNDSAAGKVKALGLILRGDLFLELEMQRQYALPAYEAAVKAAEAYNADEIELPQAYERLAECYTALKMPDSAAHYMGLAADAWEDLEAWEERMFALSKGVVAALAAKDSSLASDMGLNGIRTAPKDSVSLGRAASLYAQGKVMLSIVNVDSAMKLFRGALLLQRKKASPQELNATRLGIVAAYLARLDYGGAIRHADSALALADSIGDTRMKLAANKAQADLYFLAGDYRNGLRFLNQQLNAEAVLTGIQMERLRQAVEVVNAYEDALERAQNEKKASAQAAAGAGSKFWDEVLWYGGIGLGALLFLVLVFLVIRQAGRIRALRMKVQSEKEAADDAYEELARVEGRFSKSSQSLEQLVDERTEALKRTVEELIEVNEELDTFIGRASHDLMGPLARLKGLVLLAKGTAQEPEVAETIALIEAVSVYMDRVLRKLVLVRDVKFAGAGPKQVDLVEMLQDIEPHLTELPGVSEPDISIEDWIKRPIHVDERNLRIVLENLLENACIFSKDGRNRQPQIDVKIKKEGQMILLEVADQGIGIPDGIKDHVFDIFFRGSERSKGNGLGLYLVKRAVEGLNGTIGIESKQGSFTKFVVRFPEIG